MPITTSAKKALRQSIRRHKLNLQNKKTLKEVLKTYKKLVVSKNFDEARKQLSLVYQKLDKATKTNLLKKNASSRLKSRLTKLINVK